MQQKFEIELARICIATLLAAMLAACATTQKSSSGLGTTDDATEATPASAPVPAPQAASSAAKTTAKADAPAQPARQSRASSPAKQDTPRESSRDLATTISSQEIESEKRALAEEQARINKMRADQDASREGMDGGGAKGEIAPESAPVAAAPAQTSAKSVTVAATRPQDTQVVFPENRQSQEKGEAAQPAPSSQAMEPVASPLQHSVYFDFDKSNIKEQYDPILKANAAFLESHTDVAAEIQGNCDERGSREYNLALGARRAEAVKQALELLGVEGTKIKTVSFGAEKPIALGKDEESYSRNRRADILH